MPELLTSSENALLLILKFALILFLLIYVIFAGVVIKQVRMMADTVEVGFETPIKLVVFLHFIFSIIVLILSIFFL